MTKSVQSKFEIIGGWFAQNVEIDATCGLYDWIRRTVRLSPGDNTFQYKDVKIGDGGTRIQCPPDFDFSGPQNLNNGEARVWILDLGRIKIPEKIPDLGKFVLDEDLEEVRRDIPRETFYSSS